MWISKQITKTQDTPAVQTGTSTLNSNGQVEAVSTGAERNIGIYSPYGYSFSLPAGVKMLLAKSDGQQAAIGTLMSSDVLAAGEIMIKSSSGAYIHLKENGSVIINGLEISRNGVIVNE